MPAVPPLTSNTPSAPEPPTLPEALAQRYGEPWRGQSLSEGLETHPLLRALLSRRSVRRYRDDPVPESLLETLFACAQSAPTKSDLQQYAILLVARQDLRATLFSWLPKFPWLAEAPVFLVFCADIRRGRHACRMHGRPHANDNVDTFLNGAVDAALALGAFIHAAESAGLGCCPISLVRNHLEPLSRLLALPDGVLPICGLALGWPAEPGRISMRLPQRVVVHRDTYRELGLEEELRAYDERRHAREPIAQDKQKNPERYGTAERVTWTDQVSRQLSVPERADLTAFLHGHGFGLK